MRWAVAVTTVPQRRDSLLRLTHFSLNRAGFEDQVLCEDIRGHAYANWVLALAGLLLRKPEAEFYAVFQDDVLAVKNARVYLETSVDREAKVYYNLYNEPGNEALAGGRTGWYPSNQLGWGALGLVFSSRAAVAMVTAKHTWHRVHDSQRAKKHIDGGVVSAMQEQGYTERVHMPSLLQHNGCGQSALANVDRAVSASFPGEGFDALSLLRGRRPAPAPGRP